MKKANIWGVALLFVSIGVFAGCSKHENFPAPLNVTTPPVPTNFVITNPQGSDYDLTWGIDNAALVDRYRIYTLSVLGPPVLEAETTSTTFLVTLLFPLPGAEFGVSAVTTENVEGAMATAIAP